MQDKGGQILDSSIFRYEYKKCFICNKFIKVPVESICDRDNGIIVHKKCIKEEGIHI